MLKYDSIGNDIRVTTEEELFDFVLYD